MATRCCSFEVHARCGEARRGTLHLGHGAVQTPAFMPVGTYGSIKCADPRDLDELGAEIVLSNTFHLMDRPGTEFVAARGGLHRFMGWDKPILTDSGGFQVFSLRERRKIDEDGVTFRSPLDGTRRRMSPESTVQHQIDLGVDVAMVLDDCAELPGTPRQVRAAMERSMRWAARAAAVPRDPDGGPALFGIVQGGLDESLRSESIDRLTAMNFDGYALGGLSVGEAPEAMHSMVRFAAPRLPGAAARYLMGVGYPEDIVISAASGVDMFDCVLPSRNARRGNLFTSRGRLIIKHARWRDDDRPIDEECDCFTCQRFSRAYLRHLFVCGESLGNRLMTLHNLRHYQRLMARIRTAIDEGTLDKLVAWAVSKDSEGNRPSFRRAD